MILPRFYAERKGSNVEISISERVDKRMSKLSGYALWI